MIERNHQVSEGLCPCLYCKKQRGEQVEEKIPTVRSQSERKKERQKNDFLHIFKTKYSNMLSRVESKWGKNYAVAGRDICTKEDFILWCLELDNFKKFQRIHNAWRDSGYEYKLTPSIDRIDNDGGYTLDNMQWLTVSKNNKKHTK